MLSTTRPWSVACNAAEPVGATVSLSPLSASLGAAPGVNDSYNAFVLESESITVIPSSEPKSLTA